MSNTIIHEYWHDRRPSHNPTPGALLSARRTMEQAQRLAALAWDNYQDGRGGRLAWERLEEAAREAENAYHDEWDRQNSAPVMVEIDVECEL